MSATIGRTTYVGIDVSKATLDVAMHLIGEHFVVANDEVGISEFLGKLAKVPPSLGVLEASGGFERPVAAALASSEAETAVCVVNPRQTRDFARATGRLAKPNKIDAKVLARFAEAVRPVPRTLLDAEVREF